MVCVLTACVSTVALGQVRVVAQVDTSKDIYVGQAFAYMVIIDGENKPGQVDLTPLAAYNPQSAGNRDISQTSTTIINNKVTQEVTKRYVMSYSLTANKAGRLELPVVTVTLDGTQYRTNPVSVNILQPGTTDKLDFEVELSEQKCYVGQPVIITVKFYVAAGADVGDFQFNIPCFSSDSFYVEDPEISDPQARVFSLHSGLEVAVSQHRVVHRGEDFTVVSFSKVLIPKHPGEIDLGAPSVTAALAVGRVRPREPFFDDFGFFGSQKQYKRFAVSASVLKLSVLPLPEQGKPVGFYGLVGRYTIEAFAAPTKVSVGDPITLTIKVGGSRYLKPVQWPELEQVAELTENFKLPSQKASPTVQDGFKVFTQTVRANNDKVERIPPIPLPYFDADKGEYVVAETAPIKLEVAPTKVVTIADMQGTDAGPVNRQVEAIKKGLSANYEGPDVLTNQVFSPLAATVSPGYLVIWSVPLAGLLASALAKLTRRRDPARMAQRRRRLARSKAVKELKAVVATGPRQRQQLLASAMKQYIGDRFDKIAGSLTGDDCYRAITDATGDTRLAADYRDAIAACDASRYTPLNTDVNAKQIDEIMNLIQSIEKKLKK